MDTLCIEPVIYWRFVFCGHFGDEPKSSDQKSKLFRAAADLPSTKPKRHRVSFRGFCSDN
jgi:hypothetical protein